MLTEVNEVTFQLDSFDPVLQQNKPVQGRNIDGHEGRVYDSEMSVTAWLWASCLAGPAPLYLPVRSHRDVTETGTSKKWARHFPTEDRAVILSVKSYVHNDAPVWFRGRLEWQSFSH